MIFFKLDIITPDGSKTFEDVYQLEARSVEGDFAVLADHEAFIFHLIPGDIKLSLNNNVLIGLRISNATLVVNNKNYVLTTDYFNILS